MAWGDITNPDAWKSAMANLLRRGGEVTDYIEQAPQKAGQAIIDAGQRQQALMNEAFDPTGKTLIRNPQAANQAAMNLLEGPLGFAPAGITAWHGSPHSFDKFDMSKVGTGSGAQAFGYGGYFSKSPDLAKGYSPRDLAYENKLLNLYDKMSKSENYPAMDVLEQYMTHQTPGEITTYLKDMGYSGKELKLAEQAHKQATKLYETQKGTNLYKVDIPDTHIEQMLDWNKPLAEQSSGVLENLKKLNDPYINEAITTKPKLSKDGEYWTYMGNTYATKAEALEDASPHKIINGYTGIGKDPQEVSKALNAVGIKGTKYLDETPSAGSGTTNYVVFDPSTLQILERNNQPLTRKEVLEEQLNKLK